MSFPNEWNERYKYNTHMSIWPWSDLVSYFMRYVKPLGHPFKVLELGCGAGANIPFFLSLGVKYYAVEGSDLIVKKLHDRFPELKDTVIVSDFTQNIPFNDSFDVVIDRASLTHNTTDSIKRCLDMIYYKLNENGKFIGIDWFSTQHSDFQKGFHEKDSNTKNNFEYGQFKGLGQVHFSDKKHLEELFRQFTFDVIAHKIVQQEGDPNKHTFASWNFVATKRSNGE